jgi:hypothetical protein
MAQNHPHTMEELQQEISAVVTSASEETPGAAVRNFRSRLQIVSETDDVNAEIFLNDCQSPKPSELRDTTYSDLLCNQEIQQTCN